MLAKSVALLAIKSDLNPSRAVAARAASPRFFDPDGTACAGSHARSARILNEGVLASATRRVLSAFGDACRLALGHRTPHFRLVQNLVERALQAVKQLLKFSL